MIHHGTDWICRSYKISSSPTPQYPVVTQISFQDNISSFPDFPKPTFMFYISIDLFIICYLTAILWLFDKCAFLVVWVGCLINFSKLESILWHFLIVIGLFSSGSKYLRLISINIYACSLSSRCSNKIHMCVNSYLVSAERLVPTQL